MMLRTSSLRDRRVSKNCSISRGQASRQVVDYPLRNFGPPFQDKEAVRLRLVISSKARRIRSEEHTSELQSRLHLVCRLLLVKHKALRDPRLSEVGVVVAGGGSLLPAVQEEGLRLCIGRRIRFLGDVAGPPALYSAMHGFCPP